MVKPILEHVYANSSGRGGVLSYEFIENGIQLQFKDSYQIYVYTYNRPGRNKVERMKELALSGKGLTTYVNQYVREEYETSFTYQP